MRKLLDTLDQRFKSPSHQSKPPLVAPKARRGCGRARYPTPGGAKETCPDIRRKARLPRRNAEVHIIKESTLRVGSFICRSGEKNDKGTKPRKDEIKGIKELAHQEQKAPIHGVFWFGDPIWGEKNNSLTQLWAIFGPLSLTPR